MKTLLLVGLVLTAATVGRSAEPVGPWKAGVAVQKAGLEQLPHDVIDRRLYFLDARNVI